MAHEAVHTETGEVIPLPVKYDAREYLASLSASDGLTTQKKLAAAYDAACEALIGPNDVQVEGGRSFKKKSAWRKLARYFNISVEVVKVEREVLDTLGSHFIATVTARAVAPWGQSYEEVGACCTDEATGRRVITVADAIATASTRASNRAVSNLIAMGEVSAEEIGDRPAHTEARSEAPPARTESSAASGGEECPKCGGAMWDNRATKRNPKAPDFKCRDKSCDGVIWPEKPGAKAAPRKAAVAFVPSDKDLPSNEDFQLDSDDGDSEMPF